MHAMSFEDAKRAAKSVVSLFDLAFAQQCTEIRCAVWSVESSLMEDSSSIQHFVLVMTEDGMLAVPMELREIVMKEIGTNTRVNVRYRKTGKDGQLFGGKILLVHARTKRPVTCECQLSA